MRSKRLTWLIVLGLAVAIPASAILISYINGLHHVTTLVSTVPNVNGDVNPYGIVILPRTIGKLVRNNILVSNFNNSANLQGTGTTIVQLWPNNVRTLFAQLNPTSLQISPQRIGLTTALVALQHGWVIVGSLPTQDGTSSTATDGQIFILNSNGNVVKILSGNKIHGPWDATVFENGDHVSLFITNVLEGTVAASPNVVNNGTVVRIDLIAPLDNGSNAPTEVGRTIIGSGFPQRTDPAALVIGPTGLALGRFRIDLAELPQQPRFNFQDLFVANTLMNEIRVIHNAVTRTTSAGLGDLIFRGGALNQPLGLAATPVNSLIAANGGDGKIVEISLFEDKQVNNFLINPDGAGTLFGLVVPARLVLSQRQVFFVDDGLNALRVLR